MNWQTIIDTQRSKDYFISLDAFLETNYKTKTIYPQKEYIFKAFDLCDYDNLKVVILGQDPYHQPSQAQGLAFSTPKNLKNPPSMANIIKEIIDDIGYCNCKDGELTSWAKDGVLLINSVFTVEYDKPNSHKNKGWEIFSDNIIKHINEHKENIVFLLWGANSIKKSKLIDQNKHYILTSPHPSPLSAYRGFFGCKHFSKTNKFLQTLNPKNKINW